jgi:hypothetical protein
MTRKGCIKRIRALTDGQFGFIEPFLEDHLETAESVDWRPFEPGEDGAEPEDFGLASGDGWEIRNCGIRIVPPHGTKDPDAH